MRKPYFEKSVVPFVLVLGFGGLQSMRESAISFLFLSLFKDFSFS